jgi:hypothetical protein
MSKLRKAARGMPCLVRLPGCDGGGETTVLAHYRLAGTCGMGMKPDDEQGAHCCAKCHDIVDARVKLPKDFTRDRVDLAFAEGVFRTQAARRSQRA